MCRGTSHITAAQPAVKCRHCGRAPHHDTVCPAKGKEYNKFAKLDYVAHVCISNTKGKSKARQNKYTKRSKSLCQLEHSDATSDDEYLYPVKTHGKHRPYTVVEAPSYSFNVMVDTGASINVMERETFAKLPAITLEKMITQEFAYDNDKPIMFIGRLMH